eukprot:CAMPEP_0113442144 /NCGR_PEP_ID=MMETSP0014_2-20120614/1458_1 /TAXON_ID=2857 /ORGANISM="Nitzschia sp." /LENGTH=540 /DNA_ID=CAMNT_0000333033 /DNA_START=10 /DNA_END=1629 /DNA_ORIENTATION=+ /assembly_acc=CAM_ASM_000159
MANTDWVQSDEAFNQTKIPTTLEVGHAFKMRLIETPVADDVPIYIRPHLVERQNKFVKFIANDKLSELYVAGPPGCGKTVALSLFARMYARTGETGKKVLFVGYRHRRRCPIRKFHGDKSYQVRTFPFSFNLNQFITQLIDGDSYDLVVYDGVRTSISDSEDVMAPFTDSDQFRKAIYVTSLAFRLKDGDMGVGSMGSIYYIEDYFDSWTLDDHLAAVSAAFDTNLLDDAFKDDAAKFRNSKHPVVRETGDDESNREDEVMVSADDQVTVETIRDYVKFKYFYAGGSARFMMNKFLNPSDEQKGLKRGLDRLFELVEDWKPFTISRVPSRSPDAVNTLMQRFTTPDGALEICTALSRYVAMTAYENKGKEFVEAVKSAAKSTGNPTLKGWAFELEQIQVIKGVLQSPMDNTLVHIEGSNGLKFRPTKALDYDGTTLNGDCDDPGDDGDVVVIWCQKWNQGCFDVALFRTNDKTLTTLQFTLAQSHSQHYEYLKELRDAVVSKFKTVDRVCHIVVTPHDFLEWETPTGTGRSKNGIDFTIW